MAKQRQAKKTATRGKIQIDMDPDRRQDERQDEILSARITRGEMRALEKIAAHLRTSKSGAVRHLIRMAADSIGVS